MGKNMPYHLSNNWNPDMPVKLDPTVEYIKEALLSPEFIDALASKVAEHIWHHPINNIGYTFNNISQPQFENGIIQSTGIYPDGDI
jgi:hypothetical protein